MRIALINSGIGLLAAAAALHRMRPDADLVLASDPDGMPWGPRTPDEIAERALMCARATLRYQPDVLVMACNTGSVHALAAMRAEFEPDVPVIGTVPAIKPAAAAHHTVAIWATVATTASAYQRRLIAEFGGSAEVTAVACPGLADAVEAGDRAAAAAAVAAAAAQTPAGCEAVVLGCTEYELAADQIRQAMPGAVTFGSAAAVAAQALRRVPGAGSAAAASLHPGDGDSGSAPSGQAPVPPGSRHRRWRSHGPGSRRPRHGRHGPRPAERQALRAATNGPRCVLPGRPAAGAAGRRHRRRARPMAGSVVGH